MDIQSILKGETMTYERQINWNTSGKTLREVQLEREIAKFKQQRDDLLKAAENLIQVKGRYHTEQAYKKLEAAIAKVKE